MSINKEQLVRKILDTDKIKNYTFRYNKVTLDLVRTIYDELENQIITYLSEVDETNTSDNPKTIRLFEGVTLSSCYKPAKETVLNFSDSKDKVMVKSRVDVKANVTRYIKEKITKLNERQDN